MLDTLPREILDALRDRYVAGVADAEALFANFRADEDALTGALGQAISQRPFMSFVTENEKYVVKIETVKLRGRGKNAPEKLYGPDGVFQIEIVDELTKSKFIKTLPFQAKTNWKGVHSALAGQCQNINASLRGGIVVNFLSDGYEACSTKDAAASGGNHRKLKLGGKIQPLGQVLGNEFLECRLGHVGMFYDAYNEQFIGARGEILPPAQAITTAITTYVRRQPLP